MRHFSPGGSGAAAYLGFILLAGCGGGGSGGMSTMPGNLSSAPGEAALAGYLQASHKSTLSTTYNGNSYTVQIDDVPGSGTMSFNGSAPAYSTTDTVTLTQNGTVLATDVSMSYFLLNPYVPLGKVNSNGTPYAVVTSSTPLPASFTVGASGSIAELTYYHDSSKAAVDAQESVTYTVSARDANSILGCIDSSISGVTAQGSADGMGVASEKDCYSITSGGTATLVSVTLTVKGTTLTFQ